MELTRAPLLASANLESFGIWLWALCCLSWATARASVAAFLL